LPSADARSLDGFGDGGTSTRRVVAERCCDCSFSRYRARSRTPSLTLFVALARQHRVGGRPCARSRRHRDAVDRTGRHAQLAATAKRFEHAMHALVRTDDRVDRTRLDA